MTTREIEEIKESLLRDLPRVLEQDPRFVLFIEGIVSEKFPRRDEFARLLDEVRAGREENKQKFEKIDQRFAGMEHRFGEIKNQIHQLQLWMEVNVGGLQSRAGKRLENVVAGAFCFGLRRNDIRPENVKLRQKLTDEAGAVFRPGKQREVDIIALGQEILVFEVKSSADHDDIDDLADNVSLVRHLHPGAHVKGILVMLGAEADHRQLCAEKGLELIP